MLVGVHSEQIVEKAATCVRRSFIKGIIDVGKGGKAKANNSIKSISKHWIVCLVNINEGLFGDLKPEQDVRIGETQEILPTL